MARTAVLDRPRRPTRDPDELSRERRSWTVREVRDPRRTGVGAPDRRRRGPRSAPLIVERLRIPGLVGLLFGGMVVGPNVLGLDRPTRWDRLPARRDRIAVPDVHGRARPRPQRVRQGPQPSRRVRPHDVLRPVRARVHARRDRSATSSARPRSSGPCSRPTRSSRTR